LFFVGRTRAYIQIPSTPLFHKFWLIFSQNFSKYVKYIIEILHKSRSKFPKNRGTGNLNIGSRFILTLLLFFAPLNVRAALPFVTDDAGIADPNQLLIESFSEVWNLPKKGNNNAATLSGNYVGLSYGTNKNLEIAIGGLAAYTKSKIY
jgi:hypothetical protein